MNAIYKFGLKIFISYSRTDADNLAQKIYKDLDKKGHDVFTDVNSIKGGDRWSNTIEEKISKCDLFVIIVTPAALESKYVESEVLQSQRENKRIIPCFYKDVIERNIKWNLKSYQGIEFEDKFDLALNLYRKIEENKQYLLSSLDVPIRINPENNEKPLKEQRQTPFSDIDVNNQINVDKYANLQKDIKIVEDDGNINVKRYKISQSETFEPFQNDDYPKRRKPGFSKIAFGSIAGAVVLVIIVIAILPMGLLTNQSADDKEKAIGYSYSTQWGSLGSADGQFLASKGIATDSSGNVYVADSGNNRVQKFDSSGQFITKWGSKGKADGQFDDLQDIATDSSGNVYVADSGNNRVQKFDSSGKFITKWGSLGSADGLFDFLQGIATDSSGNVYVADYFNDRVQKFDSNGTFIAKWGSMGPADGEFHGPEDIATDSSGNVYVADYFNHRVQKFDSSGQFITKWGSEGDGDGQFDFLKGIATDSSGNVYVIDSGNHRVQKFDSSGQFITKFGREGTDEGEFVSPTSIAIGPSGKVYVFDYETRIIGIHVFSPSYAN